jgi:lipopolysaccharide/colanic/teichoic acid biosynthesis glycosyltransferase
VIGMMKRIFDLTFSTLGLIALAPIFLIISIIIKLDSQGAIFFRQERVGLNGKPFRIFKFRTMKTANSGLKITVGSDSRITKIGAFLRKYKIDELPQFINILVGEMSFVGPRPEVPEYVKYYSEANRKIVLSVPPGITDLASIKFKNENDILAKEANPEQAYITKIMPKKLRYCRFYVQNQSLCYDVVIMWKTVWAVI